MARNLDMTALRSFVAVADVGGVTKASGFLNLTQSAVSMQLKRLEDSVGISLLDRSNRTIALTSEGEQLLSYARRMLRLNDEAYSRLTSDIFEGEITLGVPHDIVYPAIPQVLRQFSANFPRVKVQLISSFTRELKAQFGRGEVDVILTTEENCDAGGVTLQTVPLIWVGAPEGQAYRSRPLRLAYEGNCIFRAGVQKALDDVGIDWEMAVESNSTRTIEATVSADLAVHTMIEGTEPKYFERIVHSGDLPELTSMQINMYRAGLEANPILDALCQQINAAYGAL
ncbi:LysR family transcriptional regulator [Algirhabdus cladophorae]|uniref:LysR family transcriptional regulator n=1 Tax=Algirhabdus cladophorae TaxID=3377108 RepID=UPI003B849478